jgi:hypothetical protein
MNPTTNGYLNSTMTQAARAPALDEVEEHDVSSGDTSASPQKKKSLNKGKGKAIGNPDGHGGKGKATGNSNGGGKVTGNSNGGGKATGNSNGGGKATGSSNGGGKGKGKFFVQSSPSRASVSDSSAITSVSPLNVNTQQSPANPPSPAKPAPLSPLSPQPPHQQPPAMRRSSGSSTGASKKKRHVSLSTMKGKYHAEKRKAAAALEAKEAREEDGGWEDDEEDLDEWSDDEAGKSITSASPKEIPPPAPTPLVRMSKKQREAAKAERAQIEAELEAQRKREMFAKQQIFGQPRGLLSQALQRGGSLVDLQAAAEQPHSHSALSSSRPAHKTIHAHTLGQSPGPSLLRSKSAVAIPVQTGVSVTVSKPLSRPVTNQDSDPPILTSNDKAPPALSNRARILPPSEEQLETTDEESQDDTLANENTAQKLAQLVQRKEAAKVAKSKSINPIPSGSEETRPSIPIAMATSPTTDRRAMITRELSESLRKSKPPSTISYLWC